MDFSGSTRMSARARNYIYNKAVSETFFRDYVIEDLNYVDGPLELTWYPTPKKMYYKTFALKNLIVSTDTSCSSRI